MKLSKLAEKSSQFFVDEVMNFTSGKSFKLGKLKRDADKAANFYDSMLDPPTSDRSHQSPKDRDHF